MVRLLCDSRVIDTLFFLLLRGCNWGIHIVFFESGRCVLSIHNVVSIDIDD